MSTRARVVFRAFFVALACGLPAVRASAQIEFPTNEVNRLSFNARGAFGIRATFKNVGNLSVGSAARMTPNGDAYNYDNGYVLTDSSGSAGGQTWYWGYDSSSQISGNTIVMSRGTSLASASTQASGDFPDISPGFEFIYNRKLGEASGWRYGVEGALGFMSISLSDSSTVVEDVTQTTDAYSFASGATPPQAPYQGTFYGPGFLISSTPVSSTSTVTPAGATVTGRRDFSATLWTLRAGPYVELPVDEGLTMMASAGPTVGLLNAKSSWSETVTITGGGSTSGSGHGTDTNLRLGGYAALSFDWKVAKNWDVQAGTQFQYLGTYEKSLGGRAVALDLTKAISVSLGASFNF